MSQKICWHGRLVHAQSPGGLENTNGVIPTWNTYSTPAPLHISNILRLHPTTGSKPLCENAAGAECDVIDTLISDGVWVLGESPSSSYVRRRVHHTLARLVVLQHPDELLSVEAVQPNS
jgi:hypothetical protein